MRDVVDFPGPDDAAGLAADRCNSIAAAADELVAGDDQRGAGGDVFGGPADHVARHLNRFAPPIRSLFRHGLQRRQLSPVAVRDPVGKRCHGAFNAIPEQRAVGCAVRVAAVVDQLALENGGRSASPCVLLQAVVLKISRGSLERGRNGSTRRDEQSQVVCEQVPLRGDAALGLGAPVRLRHLETARSIIRPQRLAGVQVQSMNRHAFGLPDPSPPIQHAVMNHRAAAGGPLGDHLSIA